MNRLLNILGIEPEERAAVGQLWTIGFLGGGSLTLYTSAVTGLFFAEFTGSMIPYAYIAGGLITVAAAGMFGLIARSVSARMMYPVYLVVLTAIILAFWLLFSHVDSKWLTAGGFVIADLLYSFNAVVLGGLAINLFTLQQSKRLGGVVGSGMVIGTFVMGLSVSLLVKLTTLVDLMLISGVLVFLMTLLCYRIVFVFGDRFSKRESTDEDAGAEAGSGIKSVLRSSYAWLVFANFIASFGVFYFVDFIFLDALDRRFPDEADLASFYGQFVGLVSLLTFIGKALVYSRVLRRFGLLATMTALPALLFLVGAGIVAGDLAGATALLFWLIVCQKLIYNVVVEVLDEPTLGVLIQAAPLTQQASMNTFINATIAPVTTALAGGLLLVLTFFQASAATITLTLAPVIALWLAFSVGVFNRYKAEIRHAVSRRNLPRASLDVATGSMLRLIESKLESGSSGEVIYCLRLLEQDQHQSLPARLVEQLQRADSAVRLFSLRRIESLGVTRATDQVRSMVHEEPDHVLRRQAIITYCALEEADACEVVKPLLDHEDEMIWQGAIIGMLRHGGIDGAVTAGPRLNQLRYSTDARDRRLAARITGEVGISHFFQPVAELLRDDDLQARRAAIQAARLLRNRKLVGPLVDCLAVPSLRTDAFHAICTFPESIAPALVERYRDETSEAVRVWLIRLAGRLAGADMTVFLLERVRDAEPVYRYEAVDALNRSAFTASKDERWIFEEAIRNEVSNGAWLRAIWGSLGVDSHGQLAPALGEELLACRNNLLKLLACVYPSKVILDAADRLGSEDEHDRSFAIEALYNEIRGSLRDPIITICTTPDEGFISAARSLELDAGLTGTDHALALAQRSFGRHSDWRVTVAIENLRGRQGKARSGLLESYLAAPVWGVRQAARRVLRQERPLVAAVAEAPVADDADEERSPLECVSLLRAVTLFAGVPGVDLLRIAEIVDEEALPSGSVLMEKGDEGDSLVVLASGSARIHDGGTELGILRSGSVAGELAALDPHPRTASITVVANALVYWLEAETLYALLAEHQSIADGLVRVLCQKLRRALGVAGPRKKMERGEQVLSVPLTGVVETAIEAFGATSVAAEDGLAPVEKVLMLKQVGLFRNCPEKSLLQLAEALRAQEYGPGQEIVSKGDRGTSLFVIFKGEVRVHDGEQELAIRGENEVFGELAALDPEPRIASISAVGRVSLFRLTRSTLRQAMKEDVEVTRGVLQYLCRRLREVQP